METMSTTPANEEIRLVSESVPTLWSDGIDVSRGPSHGKSKEGKAVEICTAPGQLFIYVLIKIGSAKLSLEWKRAISR